MFGGGGAGNGNDPFREMEELMRRMTGRAFFGADLPFGGGGGGSSFLMSSSRGSWIPPVDLLESDAHFTLIADAPGIRKEDMSVNVTGSRVCIGANRPLPDSAGNGSGSGSGSSGDGQAWAHLNERGYGKFERCFTLPSKIAESSVAAQYVDGVLEVTLPKEQSSAVAPPNRTINIK